MFREELRGVWDTKSVWLKARQKGGTQREREWRFGSVFRKGNSPYEEVDVGKHDEEMTHWEWVQNPRVEKLEGGEDGGKGVPVLPTGMIQEENDVSLFIHPLTSDRDKSTSDMTLEAFPSLLEMGTLVT